MTKAPPENSKYLHEDSRISHLQQLYGFTFTEGEVRLLQAGSMLDPYDKQRSYLLRMALRAENCPACDYILCPRSAWTGVKTAGPTARWPGSGEPVDVSWADDGEDGKLFACPACKARLVHRLGIVETDHWFTLAPGQVVSEAGPTGKGEGQ